MPTPLSLPTEQEELEKADAFLVVFSCVDKESFTRAKQILARLQDMDLIRTRPIILVANKIDLARSRAVSAQGKNERMKMNMKTKMKKKKKKKMHKGW